MMLVGLQILNFVSGSSFIAHAHMTIVPFLSVEPKRTTKHHKGMWLMHCIQVLWIPCDLSAKNLIWDHVKVQKWHLSGSQQVWRHLQEKILQNVSFC